MCFPRQSPTHVLVLLRGLGEELVFGNRHLHEVAFLPIAHFVHLQRQISTAAKDSSCRAHAHRLLLRRGRSLLLLMLESLAERVLALLHRIVAFCRQAERRLLLLELSDFIILRQSVCRQLLLQVVSRHLG